MDPAWTDADRSIARFIHGETADFEAVWSRHHERMESLAGRRLRRDRILRLRYEVAAIVQETLIRILELRACGRLGNVGSVETFWVMYRKVLAQTCSALRDGINALRRGGPGTNGHGRDGIPGESLAASHPITITLDDFEIIASREPRRRGWSRSRSWSSGSSTSSSSPS